MTSQRDIKKELGQRIRGIRRRRGMTQEDMADRCGLHWTYIGGLERGERNPTLTSMQKISDGLGVTLSELVGPAVSAASDGRDAKEGRLMKLLRRKDDHTVDLAANVIRAVLNWRERQPSK